MPQHDDEFEIAGFDNWMTTQSLGRRTTIAVPAGLGVFRPKREEGAAHTLSIIAFPVSPAHRKLLANIQPPQTTKVWFEVSYYGHRGIGVNRDKYVCPAATFGRKCAVCEARAEFAKSPDKQSQENAKALRNSKRQLWLVFDHDQEDRGLQLWDEAAYNFGDNLTSYIKATPAQLREKYMAFAHPTRGCMMRIACKVKPIGKTNNYEYHIHSMYERPQPLPDHIVRHNLDPASFIVALDYDQLKAVYDGVPDEDEEDTTTPAPPVDAGSFDDIPVDPTPVAPPPPPVSPPRAVPARQSRAAAPPPPAAPATNGENLAGEFGVLDIVEFEWNNERVQGQVQSVDQARGLLFVSVEGYAKQLKVMAEDCTMIQQDGTFDLTAQEPEPVSPPPPPPARQPAAQRRQATPATAPAGKKAADAWDLPEDNRSATPKKPKK